MCVLCIKLVIATTVTGDMQCVYVRGDDYVYSFKVAFNMAKVHWSNCLCKDL